MLFGILTDLACLFVAFPSQRTRHVGQDSRSQAFGDSCKQNGRPHGGMGQIKVNKCKVWSIDRPIEIFKFVYCKHWRPCFVNWWHYSDIQASRWRFSRTFSMVSLLSRNKQGWNNTYTLNVALAMPEVLKPLFCCCKYARYDEIQTKLTPFLRKVGFNPKTGLCACLSCFL